MVAIIDYDAGNIKSVEKAVCALGKEVVVSRDVDEILSAKHVILPGVGAFGDAMEKLHKYGLVEVIREVTDRKTPFLGICLGLQLLFESSEESEGVEGLGILSGKITKIPEGKDLKIPHIGWNSLCYPNSGRLFRNIPENSYVTATTQYGITIHASVEKENIFACQFHPEKSSDVGMTILKNFLDISSESGRMDGGER